MFFPDFHVQNSQVHFSSLHGHTDIKHHQTVSPVSLAPIICHGRILGKSMNKIKLSDKSEQFVPNQAFQNDHCHSVKMCQIHDSKLKPIQQALGRDKQITNSHAFQKFHCIASACVLLVDSPQCI